LLLLVRSGQVAGNVRFFFENDLFDPGIGYFTPQISLKKCFFRLSRTQWSIFTIHSGPLGGNSQKWVSTVQWSAGQKQPKMLVVWGCGGVGVWVVWWVWWVVGVVGVLGVVGEVGVVGMVGVVSVVGLVGVGVWGWGAGGVVSPCVRTFQGLHFY
jgi:hypothetical protein